MTRSVYSSIYYPPLGGGIEKLLSKRGKRKNWKFTRFRRKLPYVSGMPEFRIYMEFRIFCGFRKSAGHPAEKSVKAIFSASQTSALKSPSVTSNTDFPDKVWEPKITPSLGLCCQIDKWRYFYKVWFLVVCYFLFLIS